MDYQSERGREKKLFWQLGLPSPEGKTRGPFNPCNLACAGWVEPCERDFNSAKRKKSQGVVQTSARFVSARAPPLGRMSNDMDDDDAVLLTCHF